MPAAPRSFLRNHGLSLLMLGLFAMCLAGHGVTGWLHGNEERRQRHEAQQTLGQYLASGAFLETVGENWESEFLQMGVFVIATACLYEKGSPESNDPDQPDADEPPVTARSPWPVRRGGLAGMLYARSLSIALLLLFALSLLMHAIGGCWDENQERAKDGEPPLSVGAYLGTSRFWFESFQNWQSEFLSIAAMVFLSVYLRQRGSAQSKPVTMAHADHD